MLQLYDIFIFITTCFTWITVCHLIILYLLLRADNALASAHIITSNDNGHIQKISAIWIHILGLQFAILQTAQNYFVICCVWARIMFCMSVWLQCDNCCFDMYLACALQILKFNCAFWWLSKHTFYYTLYANLYDIAQAYIPIITTAFEQHALPNWWNWKQLLWKKRWYKRDYHWGQTHGS